MKRRTLLIGLLWICPALLWAQPNPIAVPDSGKIILKADTAIKKIATQIHTDVPGLKSKLNVPDTGKINHLASTPINQAATQIKADTAGLKNKLNAAGPDNLKKQANTRLKKSLEQFQKKPVPIALIVGNDIRYNPDPILPNSVIQPKFLDIFSIRGTMQLFGVPVNLDYTNDRASSTVQQGIRNDLFKFDFNPQQFNTTLKSDLQSYNELRRGAFGGLDLTAYTSKTINNQLIKKNALDVLPNDRALAQYMDNSALINQLLAMSPEQMREKLGADLLVARKKAADSLSQKNILIKKGNINTAYTTQLQLQLADVKGIAEDKPLKYYMDNAANVSKLKLMTADQIADSINAYHKPPEPLISSLPANDNALVKKLCGFDINMMIDNECRNISATYAAIVKRTAAGVFIAVRQTSKSDFDVITADEQVEIQQKLNAAAGGGEISLNLKGVDNTVKQSNVKPGKTATATPQQIDSIVEKISSIKEQLQSKGLDVNRMLQMQQVMSENSANPQMSEQVNNYLEKKPDNKFQSMLSNINSLKAGSFGNNINGGANSQDIFMSGTHLTYNTGFAPVTVGYGSLNDINSAKDDGFKNSVYSQPRNVTYIGIELKRALAGLVKLSIVSSVNNQISNNMYSIPTAPQNNFAFTLSKKLDMGKAGQFGVDLSKSTTLYDNKFDPGGEVILNKQGGMSYNLNDDIFSSTSVGFTHHLDMKDINASDNLYFNYAGLGYQNPAANGHAGARMKMGGTLKKMFYKNRLTVNLRTDLTNMPISYTNNDQWKTYMAELDTRYVFSKKFNLSLKYMSNATDKRVDDISAPVYSFQKIQVDGNLNYKIGKYFTATHFTIGKQDFSDIYSVQNTGGLLSNGSPQNAANISNPGAPQGAANLLMLNYTQSMVIKSNTLTASIFYNKELSNYHLIGNMLNSDVGYQYTLFTKVSFSSGITYLDNEKIARQAGIRQGIQLAASSNFDIAGYVDLRKNLISSIYPDLYSACRGELSFKYYINRK